MAKIFVSYSRKDSKTARELIESFTTMGHDVWVDWEDIPPAVDWLEQIFRGIEGSEVFIFIVSPDSIKSEVCNVEIGRAALNNKRIIPVVVRDVEPKTSNEIIRKLNWTFIRKGESLEDGLAKIKTAIEIDLDWVEEHNRLQSRALVWHRKKDPSLLLSGRDLRNARNLVLTAGKKDPVPTDLQKTYIEHSYQNERRKTILLVSAIFALVVMMVLTFYAIQQSNIAIRNFVRAEANQVLAEEQAQVAKDNEQEANAQRVIAEEQQKIAEDQQRIAEEQTKIAQAQRSAARAQIYQTQPGELYTSTLFALDAWETAMTDEAGEILRKNISLLPIPVEQMYHAGNILSLEFNPAGDLFVTASADSTACVWKVSDGTKQFCATSPKSVNDAVFSPDGKLIVTGDDSGHVQIIRVDDGSVLNTYEAGVIVWDVDIRKNGDQVAVTRDDGKITLLELQTGKRKYDLQAFGKLKVASFSLDGKYIAAGSSAGSVTLWNIADGGPAVSSGRHQAEVLTLAFSPDGKYLVTGGADSYIVVARTSDGRELYRRLNEDVVQDIAFAPDSSWFATVSNDRRVRLWDTTDGDERLRMSQNSFVQTVKVSANGQWLATTGLDKTVRVWNASTGAEMFQIPLKGNGSALGFSQDGKYLVAGDSTGEINIWDISVMPVPESYLQFAGLTRDLQYSPSGDWLAASDENRVWLLKPEQLSTLTARPQGTPNFTMTGNVNEMVFSIDSMWLGISTDAGHVILYSFEGKFARTIKSTGSEYELAFSPDGGQLITSSSTGLVETWDVNTAQKTRTLFEEGSGITSVTTSPQLIAFGMTDKIVILNASAQPTEIASPGDHQLLAFNADGSFLASSNSAGLVEIWKYENGEFAPGDSIRKEAVHSLAFNPRSGQLAVGTINNIYLINPNTVTETARIPQAGTVYGVSYSADGKTLVTASLKAIQFWDVAQIETIESDNLVQAACSRLKVNFSYAQWSNLFGDEEYRLLCENLPVP